MKKLTSLLFSTAALTFAAASAHAQYTSSNLNVYDPNTGMWPSNTVTLNGTSFTNLGLQGVGRIAASMTDPVTGESVGSISSMQVTNFVNNGDGTFSGVFNFLPDRGYNSGTTYSNFAARINQFSFNFTPYTSAANTTAQNQITTSFLGSTRFTYDNDGNAATAPVYTTGLLATGSTTLNGISVPAAAGASTLSDGTVTNRLSLDSEALVLLADGSGYIGDEYGANIYHFNSSKQIDGVLGVPSALVPRDSNGNVTYSTTPSTGRRDNQGFEGVSVYGNKLFALEQSATIQDSGSGNQGRYNARLVVYDLSGSSTPGSPTAQYVIQLPRVEDTGSTSNGTSVDKTAAQSEIVAINDHQLLVLSREGNGRGANDASAVFKSVLLVDLNGATNINGLYDNQGAAVSPGGVLNPSITPISWTEALNMLGKVTSSSQIELAKFGLNLGANNGDINTLSEKWEALGLVSANDPNAPNDYFLFIGNDNDFLTSNIKMYDANGTLQTYNGGLENDSMVLAYRVQITPTPEPASAALILGGAALLMNVRRRR